MALIRPRDDMAMLGTRKRLIIRYAHRDSGCPEGYESGTFLHFGGHHGRGGYGAWIKEPEEMFDQEDPEPAGKRCSPNAAAGGTGEKRKRFV